MTSELQSLNQIIAEKVGQELVDLIPKEDWQNIVYREALKFKQTVLPDLIQETLRDKYKEKITKTLDELIVCSSWDELQEASINEKLIELIASSSGVIVAGMLGPAMQQVMQELRNRMY